jgi:hypothetical protein
VQSDATEHIVHIRIMMCGVIRTFQDWPQDDTAAINRELTCSVEEE